MMRRALLVSLLWLGNSGCGAEVLPASQIVLFVDTDAPLPDESSDAVVPLFDRIRFDVYPALEDVHCAGCSRAFPITAAMAREGAISIGIKPPPHTRGIRLRVRIYRSDYVLDGEPLDRTSLDAFVSLPPVGDEGAVTGSVFLPTDSVGQSQGTLKLPLELGLSGLGESRVGTWPHAHPVGCGDMPRAGEACVPGGASWMGHPVVPGGFQRDDVPAPRLAVLAPFVIDETEVTVAEVRAWLLENDPTWDPATAPDPVPWSGEESLFLDDLCTLPADLTDASRDTLPINCISRERARQICASREGDLPSEAQLEHVARGPRGGRFPWGGDEPSCDDAVFARAGNENHFEGYPSGCRLDGSIGGPLEVGSGLRDAVPLDATVVDLAGNLAELARDDWDPQSGACWAPTLTFDPLCEHPDAQPVIRGGSWTSAAYELQGAFRAPVDPTFEPGSIETQLGPHIGFRCARPVRPQQP